VHGQQSFDEMKSIEKHFGREIIRVPTDDTMEIENLLKKAMK
jgi:ATP-dependent RNA helicase DDX19/DBP5